MGVEARKNITEQEEYDNSTETLEDIVLSECKEIIENHAIDDSVMREIIKTSLEPVQEFSRPLWRLYRETSQNCSSVFNILSPKLFLRIIKHIRNIAYQKLENRAVGISIIVFAREEDVENRYNDYDMQPISIQRNAKITDVKRFFEDQENDLKRAYKGIKSKEAFFAFVYNKDDESLIFKGIRKVEANNFERQCGENAVGFKVSEGVPCVRIYHQRNHILDYIRSESTGDWVIRIKDDLKKIIEDQVTLGDKDLDILTEIVMQLSYLRIGAMLIITPDPDQFQKRIASHNLTVARLEDYFESKLIYQYAADDGAVIIQLQNNRLWVCYNGAVLNPQGMGYSKEYDDLIARSNCGTRHEKAARHACENHDDCIIVVSENRSISILHGPEPIYWRDDPNPLKK